MKDTYKQFIMKNSLSLMSYFKLMTVSIHMRNKQILATEMYQLINNLLSPIMNRVFKLNSHIRYDLSQILKLSRSQVR